MTTDVPNLPVVKLLVIRISPLIRTIVSVIRTPLWALKGRAYPIPPHLKRRFVINQMKNKNFGAFIETGTYRGDMLARVIRKTNVPVIRSIELDHVLATEARQRFKGQSRIEILEGDSGILLKEIVKQLPYPRLYWLDGHYSGGVTACGDVVTPIYEELASISKYHKESDVVLIDDIRLFNGHDGYPDLNDLLKHLIKLNPNWAYRRVDDTLIIE